jgi:DNA-binding transcriptional regulator YdaS (Cro superfamily)
MKLAAYLKAADLDDAAFAALSKGAFSAEAVRKWRFGVRTPRPKQLSLIAKLTKGQVTANDFMDMAASERGVA